MRTILLIVFVFVLTAFALSGCLHNKKAPDNAPVEWTNSKPPTEGEKSQVKTYSLLRWLIFVGIATLGASVALCFFFKPAGFAGIAASLATIFAAVVLNQHLVLISWIGLLLGVAILAVLIWYAYKNRKELLERGAALIQVVKFNEAAKPLLGDNTKTLLYGDKNNKGLAGKVETTETERRVAAIRKEIAASGPAV